MARAVRRYADILGRAVEINGTERRIVGVMPSHFEMPEAETDVWLPLVIDPERDHLANFGTVCIARLKNGTTVPVALRDLTRFTDRILEEFPEQKAGPLLARSQLKPRIDPLLEVTVGDVKQKLSVRSASCFSWPARTWRTSFSFAPSRVTLR